MRLLVLLRGLPGIGKSSFIKKWDLEGHTLSADTVRTLFACPVREPAYGNWDIDQRYNKKVFAFIKDRMQERMRRGETLFMDEQNIDVSEYKQMSDRFAYELIVVQFPIDKDRAIEQNSKRLPVYKRVPISVIEKSYERMKNTDIPSGIKVMSPEAFAREYIESVEDVLDMRDANGDMSIFFPNGCVFFGDIHGCMQPLHDYFAQNLFSDKKLYVFLGDYLDRGPQNGETLEFLIQLSKKPNCIFLEGNHFWERMYANGYNEDIMSDEFLQYTVPQIAHIPKEDIREFCSKWKPYYCFQYGKESYFCSHAGFGYLPDDVFRMSMHDFVKGNKYSDDVDSWYNAQAESWMPVQVHGHRNQYKYHPTKFTDSINLCSPVEFGGPLMVMEVDYDGRREFLTIENTYTDLRSNLRENALTVPKEKTQSENILLELRRHPKEIREKVLPNGVSSFNFSRDVFFKQRWDDLSKYARGLFLDSITGEVIARSWTKFFNWGEYECSDDYIKEHMEFPVVAYSKYNGYLGLLSIHDGELFFASKTTTEGPYAENFRKIFETTLSAHDQHRLKNFLAANNTTMLFEVIDPENDPHIVKYAKKGLVLLDIIENSHRNATVDYETLERAAFMYNLQCKEQVRECNCWMVLQEFKKQLESETSDLDIEGVVLEGANKFRVKIKTHFYKMWKHLRAIKERIQKGGEVMVSALTPEERKVFDFMNEKFTTEDLQGMSIIDVREAYYKTSQEEQE